MSAPIELPPPDAARIILTAMLSDVFSDLLNNRMDARKFQLMTNVVAGLSTVPSETADEQPGLWPTEEPPSETAGEE